MLPRRSSTNSQRRSSILKPPKSRQPFQDLDFNASSPENSPDSNKKRRVSFAEKKHVKEFCDHKEQGTIWDSTYEEPDQSASRSTEISNENADCANAGIIKYTENVDTVDLNLAAGLNFLRNDNRDLLDSESYVIMDSNSVEKSSKNVYYNSGRDLELTGVIPCVRGTSRDSMSQTIFCEDAELEITEAIGGIEPTVSLKKIADPNRREMRNYGIVEEAIHKDPEHTMLFDSSGRDMDFTEAISGRKIQSVPDHQDLEKSSSFIENQTIIFEDSIMELTLTNSQSEIDLGQNKNVENHDLRNADKENIRSGDNDQTLFFNDFACDMTEAVNTVAPRMPGLNLRKRESALEPEIANNSVIEKLALHRQDVNCSVTSEGKNLSMELNSTPTIPDIHGNKTIIFNDFGCEMTAAISTQKPILVQDENIVERNEAEEIVPKKLAPIVPVMEIESEKYHGELEMESSPKLISRCNNRTELFNDSAMEFTTAVTREKNMQIETCTVEKNLSTVFGNCELDVTEDARAALGNLNPGSCTKERIYLSSNELESSELPNNRKRKSIELEADSSNLLIDRNAENDLVQNLIHEESNSPMNDSLSKTFTPDSKRLKIADLNNEETITSVEDEFVTVESVPSENLTSKTSSKTSPSTPVVSGIEILVPFDVEIENNRVTILPENNVESIEDIPVVAVSNTCDNDEERSIIDDNIESETEELRKRIEDDVNNEEEESSILAARLEGLNSDSESEILKTSLTHDKHQKSLTEENINSQSDLEPNDCLENNDNCCFVLFCEEIEKHAKRDNCIWTIRSLDMEKVLIDFISNSLVVVINLEATEELTSPRIIKDIKLISLLPDSADEDISMIHDIVLKKFDVDNIKKLHRTTQDVLPLLEIISHRIKLMFDFMCELDKLEDLHLINRSGNRISFRLHSYKVQLVIKITIDIEPLEDVGPNDIVVECILGNIREKDIKQLITSVKKDHRFLTNYINDIKEYIALVVEK